MNGIERLTCIIVRVTCIIERMTCIKRYELVYLTEGQRGGLGDAATDDGRSQRGSDGYRIRRTVRGEAWSR